MTTLPFRTWPRLDRRSWLRGSAAGLIGSMLPAAGFGRDRPKVDRPRATDGDDAFEPNWDERLTIRVGPDRATVGPDKADLIGQDDKVVQAAVDYVNRLGGGTVHVLPGTYTFRNAVHLPSRIRLLGSGGDAVLTKIGSERVDLADDSDWYDQEITLASAAGFRVGDGVALMAKNPDHGGQIVIKRTLTARSGNRFKLSDGLRENLWLSGRPTCSSLFPLLTSEHTSDVVLENLTLDGNRDNNENFNGNYGGCVFLQDCSRYTIRNVETRNYNGDGISFQICHDVVVEGCHSHHNRDLGLHPGSGSQRPVMRNNRLAHNRIGIFWCWGVKYGLAEGNRIDANGDYGISIGHCDTDNVMVRNRITGSGKVGLLFRDDTRGKDFWANRNTFEENQIVNSGEANGVAIDITGKTRDVRIAGNEIRELRQPMQRTGIRIGGQVGQVELVGNRIEGFATPIVDHRST